MVECTTDKKGATTEEILCSFSISLMSLLSGDSGIKPRQTYDIPNNIGFITWEAILLNCNELLNEEQIDNQNLINISIKNLTKIQQNWITSLVGNNEPANVKEPKKGKGKKDKKTDKKAQEPVVTGKSYLQCTWQLFNEKDNICDSIIVTTCNQMLQNEEDNQIYDCKFSYHTRKYISPIDMKKLLKYCNGDITDIPQSIVTVMHYFFQLFVKN